MKSEERFDFDKWNEEFQARIRRDRIRGLLRAAAIMAIIVLVIGGFVAAGFLLTRASCHQQGDQLGRKVEWRVLSGCFVQTTNGQWVHEDQFRVNEGGD